MQPPGLVRFLALLCLVSVPLPGASTAWATLTLNGTGTGLGFTLTTTISYPYISNSAYTLASVGVASTGNLIAPANGGPTYLFSDSDGQTLGSALGTQALPSGNGFVMATIGTQVYGAQALGGGYYNFNSNGTVGLAIPVVGATAQYGLWGDTANNRLLSASSLGIISIDPSNGSYSVVHATPYLADGVTVTPDGSTAYVADVTADEVIGYSLLTANFGQQIFSTGPLGHGSDGMGVLAGTCSLAGSIVVNNNDGTVGLINPSSGLEMTIASGGNRGDFASADPSNGTLFLSQNDQIARLRAPTGCAIGSSVAAPEPASLEITGAALLLLLGARRRRSWRTPAPFR